MDVYIVYICGNIAVAHTKYSAAVEHVLSEIAELTGKPYTGSTEEELNRYLDDNVDVAYFEPVWLSDDY